MQRPCGTRPSIWSFTSPRRFRRNAKQISIWACVPTWIPRALCWTLYASGSKPRLVFSSSVAVFGGDADMPLPRVIHDDTLPVPQTSYGIQKFICEQLVADYSRRGLIDGRSVRLMTVTVRPGRPNAAASGFLSSIMREPLNGQQAVCPVPRDTRWPSPRRNAPSKA